MTSDQRWSHQLPGRVVFVLCLLGVLGSSSDARAECAFLGSTTEEFEAMDQEADWVFVGDIVRQTPVSRVDSRWNSERQDGRRRIPVFMAVTFDVVDALKGDLPYRVEVGVIANVYSDEPLPGRRYRVRAFVSERGAVMSVRCGTSSFSADTYPDPGCSRCAIGSRASSMPPISVVVFAVMFYCRRTRRR